MYTGVWEGEGIGIPCVGWRGYMYIGLWDGECITVYVYWCLGRGGYWYIGVWE